MSNNILFDNIIITEELTIAEKWASDTFDKKRQKISKDSVSLDFLTINILTENLKPKKLI